MRDIWTECCCDRLLMFDGFGYERWEESCALETDTALHTMWACPGASVEASHHRTVGRRDLRTSIGLPSIRNSPYCFAHFVGCHPGPGSKLAYLQPSTDRCDRLPRS
ncbi:hypothetical protein K474DRAFT_1037585 [Panus rudis PR-1116 ss-1]|nr:hypothetical protein K474DRAFT_1037585 [Panus rudis PR-1116 ss-1]